MSPPTNQHPIFDSAVVHFRFYTDIETGIFTVCQSVCCFHAVTIACRRQQFHWFVTCSYLIPRHDWRPRKSLISCVPLSSRGLYHF